MRKRGCGFARVSPETLHITKIYKTNFSLVNTAENGGCVFARVSPETLHISKIYKTNFSLVNTAGNSGCGFAKHIQMTNVFG